MTPHVKRASRVNVALWFAILVIVSISASGYFWRRHDANLRRQTRAAEAPVIPVLRISSTVTDQEAEDWWLIRILDGTTIAGHEVPDIIDAAKANRCWSPERLALLLAVRIQENGRVGYLKETVLLHLNEFSCMLHEKGAVTWKRFVLDANGQKELLSSIRDAQDANSVFPLGTRGPIRKTERLVAVVSENDIELIRSLLVGQSGTNTPATRTSIKLEPKRGEPRMLRTYTQQTRQDITYKNGLRLYGSNFVGAVSANDVDMTKISRHCIGTTAIQPIKVSPFRACVVIRRGTLSELLRNLKNVSSCALIVIPNNTMSILTRERYSWNCQMTFRDGSLALEYWGSSGSLAYGIICKRDSSYRVQAGWAAATISKFVDRPRYRGVVSETCIDELAFKYTPEDRPKIWGANVKHWQRRILSRIRKDPGPATWDRY